MRASAVIISILALGGPLRAATLTVDDDGPADFNDIRSAMAAAVSGDTIIVADGLYRGPGNRNIDFAGKAVVLISAAGPERCIIDCENKERGFYFHQSEGQGTAIDGFTVMRGRNSYGAGIHCTNGASPTIRNCIVRANYATYSGGGIYCENQAAPLIENCIISSNRSDSQGGGITCSRSNAALIGCTIAENSSYSGAGLYDYYSDMQITNCTFERNTSTYRAGAIHCYRSSPSVTNCIFNGNYAANYGGAVYFSSQGNPVFANCTFNANTSDNRGGGLYCSTSSMSVTLTHCVFSHHTSHAIYCYWAPTSVVRYCLFYANEPGDYYDYMYGTTLNGGAQINAAFDLYESNISGDPRFAFDGDVRLTPGSACIDAGASDLGELLAQTDPDGNPRPLDGNADGRTAVDIGVFEYNPSRPSIALSAAAIEFVGELDGTDPEPATLAILNAGGGTLNWRIDCDSPWLSVASTSGSSATQASEVTLSAHLEGVPQGVHQAFLTVRDTQADGASRTVLVTLRVKGTLYVPMQYGTIQEAVDAAMEGETVEVQAGTYHESVFIRQPVNLIGIGRPVISAVSSRVVSLETSDSTVEGFETEGGTIGIYVGGPDNTVSGNLVSGAGVGIQLDYGSSGNVLSNNEVMNCTTAGLYINHSLTNTLRGTNLHDNACNFRVVGDSAADYVNDIDKTNTVNGKSVYYLVDRSNVTVGPGETAGCVIAVGCSNVAVSGQTFSHNGYGVLFVGTSRSRVEDCTISDNIDGGIVLQESSNNTLMNNTVSNCGYGINLDRSGNSLMRGNKMTDNECNFGCFADTESDWNQDIATSNRVNGKPIYYIVGLSQVAIDRSSNAGCVVAVGCSHVTIRDLTFEGNRMGIVFAYTDDSLIENVATVNNEWAGVWLFSCSGSTVSASRVSDNGEGIYVEDCQGTLLDGNLITFNQRGIYTSVSDIEIANCFVSGNSPNGGVCIESGTQARILNCTISGNGGTENMYPEPSGIYCGSSSQVTLGNSIVWANYPTQFSGSDTITARYCDIQGGYDGQGNIDAPPLLTPDGHIRLGSPCIRAGAALAGMFSHYDIDGELRSGRGGVDIGLDQYNDADSDGLPDWWETEYFNDKRIASPDWDTDGDAHTNLTEYEAYSSDPTIPAASFYVSADRPDDSGDGSSWETAKRSIQAAIDLSGNSDAVYVGPGLYEENVTTAGRLIMLAGIDAQDPDVVAGTVIAGTVAIDRGETPGCVLSGLTITNRSSTGLLCSGSSPTIANCSIINCFCMDYQQAGGIMLLNASPKITQCVISGNIAPSTGGGLLCRSSSPVLRQCVITGNLAQYGSGGEATAIYAEQSHVTLDNCTIAYNANAYQSPTSGSTIACTTSDVTITNSILWNSQSVQVRSNESTVKVTYSDIQGGTQTLQGLTSSVGNIAVDPCFVSPGSWDSNPAYSLPSRWITGDYHLQSTGWRWTPIMTHGTHWVWDSRTSRCIDAGNPADPLGAEPVTVPNDPAGEWGRNARINMGAYGGTREASMAPHDWALRSDINNDGIVSLPDLPYVGQALRSRAARLPADLTRDSRVDYADLALMADEWLRTTDWCRIKPGRFR